MTGRYIWCTRLQHGMVTGGGEPLFAACRLTVPAMFTDKSYSTAMVDKWHLEYQYEVPEALKDTPLSEATKAFMLALYPVKTKIIERLVKRGFDTFYGFHHSRDMSNMVRNDKIEKVKKNSLSRLDIGKAKKIYAAQSCPYENVASIPPLLNVHLVHSI